MNMITLDLTGPVANRLAQTALHRRLQKWFNLYPGKIAEEFLESADRRGVQNVAGLAEKEIEVVMGSLIRSLELAKLPYGKFAVEWKEQCKLQDALTGAGLIHGRFLGDSYFNLNALGLRRDMEQVAKDEGIDQYELASYLFEPLTRMFHWALQEALEIIKRRKS